MKIKINKKNQIDKSKEYQRRINAKQVECGHEFDSGRTLPYKAHFFLKKTKKLSHKNLSQEKNSKPLSLAYPVARHRISSSGRKTQSSPILGNFSKFRHRNLQDPIEKPKIFLSLANLQRAFLFKTKSLSA